MTSIQETRASQSQSIVPAGYLLTTRSLALSYLDDADGCREMPHTHPEHTLFFPEQTAAALEVSEQRWPLALGQGLWVPAGVSHSASRSPQTTLAATYISVDAIRAPIDGVGPVVVNAALRELLQYLAYTAMPRPQRLRAQIVCLEMITAETRPSIQVILPKDPRISHIAQSIMHKPSDDRSIEQWAIVTAQSARTIARAFRAETGLTFTQWRMRARMSLAIQLLGDGMPVGTVARRVGYATNSAFTATFQRIIQRKPRDFLPCGTF